MIKGRIRVNKWHVSRTKTQFLLLNNPRIRASLMRLGEDVAERTRQNFLAASKPQKITYEKWAAKGGTPYYWSAEPSRVAQEVFVKNQEIFDTRFGSTLVTLVVANHPYSLTYEKGHDEFPQVNAMAKALQRVASKNKRVARRTP